ncbi:MAG: segregation/condensation protein A [Patescibacteria group bacterium]|nr:segregation/condensation protein A [Patescibacteria group bacterium]
MNFQLAMELYQGPLEKLLELIEEKKMEISTFNLAQVTGDFLKYLETITDRNDHQLLADFLVIASKLLLIKSRSLLPNLPLTEEEESEIKNLEDRLKIYQELKNARIHIKTSWRELPQMFSREFMIATEPLFYPPKKISPKELHKAFLKIIGELERILKTVVVIKREVINLKIKIEEILKRLTEGSFKFSHLHSGKSRTEIIVLFVAILHLIKDQLIRVEQPKHFEEITVVRKEKNE